MYKRLYEVAEEQQVDFVKSDYSSFCVENGENVIINYEYNAADYEYYGKVFSAKEIPAILYQNGVSIWTGLYKRDFILKNKIYLNESEGASFQDTGFSVLTHVLAERMYYLKESFYRYRTDNANSSVKSQKKYKVIADECRWIDNQLKEHNVCDIEILKSVMIKKIIAYHWNFDRLDQEMSEKFCEYIHEELMETYVNKGFDKVMPEYIRERFEQMFYNLGSEFVQKNVIDRIDTLLKNNKVYLVSAGRLGKKVAEYDVSKNINAIKGIFDNNVTEICVLGETRPVKKVKDIEVNNEYLYLIANKVHTSDLKRQLEDMGICKIEVCDYFPIERIEKC